MAGDDETDSKRVREHLRKVLRNLSQDSRRRAEDRQKTNEPNPEDGELDADRIHKLH
jgi:hypothetical protein